MKMKEQRMSPIERLAMATLLLLIASLVTLNLSLAQWQPDISPLGGVPAALGSATVPELQLQQAPQVSTEARRLATNEILARPLFEVSRRPPPPSAKPQIPVAPKVADAPFPADKYVLVGTMRLPKQPARALLRTGANGPSAWIAEGASLAGWVVKSIGDDRVEFVAYGTTGVLKIASTAAGSGTNKQR